MSAGIKGRPSGGDFHPASAKVYGPARLKEASGESIPDPTPTLIMAGAVIKSPRGLYTQERDNQGHPNSTSDLVIEVRNEGGGDNLSADMWFEHMGRQYYIKGPLGGDYRVGTTLYQVTTQNDYGSS